MHVHIICIVYIVHIHSWKFNTVYTGIYIVVLLYLLISGGESVAETCQHVQCQRKLYDASRLLCQKSQ